MGVVRAGRLMKPSMAERAMAQHGGGLHSWEAGAMGSGLFSSLKNAFTAGKSWLAKHPALVSAAKGAFEGFKEGGLAGALKGGLQGAVSKSENLQKLLGAPQAAAAN